MKKILVLAVLAVAVLAALPASATCIPEKQFGQLGSDGTFTYTFFPPDMDPASLVGRFWQAGNRALGNEGAYGVSNWMTAYGEAGEYYMNGFLGNGDVFLCPSNAMIALVQAQTPRGSAFVVGKVAENPGNAVTFDYTLIVGRGAMTAFEIPNPAVAVTNKAGTVLTMNVNAAPIGGYYGDADNSTPTATLSGLRLMSAFGTTRPSPAAAGWTYAGQTAPTTGGPLGFTFDCATAPAGQDLFLAWQVSFDGGQQLGDFVGASTQVRCNSTLANPKGKPIGKGHDKH